MQIPNPDEGTDLMTWADQVVYALGNYANIAQLTDPKDWQRWGMLFLNAPTLAVLVPPNPYSFPETQWVLWGQQLSEALGAASGSSGGAAGGTGGGIVPGGGAAILTQGGAWILTQGGAPIQIQN